MIRQMSTSHYILYETVVFLTKKQRLGKQQVIPHKTGYRSLQPVGESRVQN